MSGLKTEILNEDRMDEALCLDFYPDDGSVRLMSYAKFQGMDGVVRNYEDTAHVHLSKKEMLRLINTYLKHLAEMEG